MERVKTIFCSSEKSKVNFELECFANTENEIYIKIEDPENKHETMFICFNKLTAIKFVKHLKKEISFLESEVKDEKIN